MAGTYQCCEAHNTRPRIVSGRDAVAEGVLYAGEAHGGQHALVLGNADDSAFAVTGTPDELCAFAAAVTRLAERL